MAHRPPELVYSVNEKPPILSLFLFGLQHICIITITMIFPVVIVETIGGSNDEAMFMVSMGMLASGITTVLQSYGKHGIGSGYLCPSLCGPSYLSSAMMAAQAGGLHVLYGMTFLSGIAESLFSQVITKLKRLFPAEVTGVVVTFVGIAIFPVAFPRFIGYSAETRTIDPLILVIGISTLAIIIGLNIFTKSRIRLYCLLIGTIFGYILAAATGALNASHINEILQAPLFGFPDISHFGLAFDMNLILPFFIAMICSTLKSVGDVTTCQRINDLDWKRPDMNNLKGGILADGLADVISGLLGTFSQSTSSSNIGLSIGTGVTSRYIGYSIGIILVILSIFPRLSMAFVIMPFPVMGAVLLYAASFMVIAGFQIIMSRMIDDRKAILVGISFLVGLSAMVPGLYANVPEYLRPVFASPLSLATITVIFLNLLIFEQVTLTKKLQIDPKKDNFDIIFNFMRVNGSSWGAESDVIARATSAIYETIEAILVISGYVEKIDLKVSFDRSNLDVEISYKGPVFRIHKKTPSEEVIIKEATGSAYLAGYIVSRYTEKVKTSKRDEISYVFLHFNN